jgi:lysyl endopeptidase
LTTDGFYRSASCGSAETNPATRRLTGDATLLHAAMATDVALQWLFGASPSGAVYAGSYFGAAPAVGDTLAGLHHPSGDLQKFSLRTLQRYPQCNPAVMECSPAAVADAGFLTLA